jgi:hypothetical protein
MRLADDKTMTPIFPPSIGYHLSFDLECACPLCHPLNTLPFGGLMNFPKAL